jgi:hypothetical protein
MNVVLLQPCQMYPEKNSDKYLTVHISRLGFFLSIYSRKKETFHRDKYQELVTLNI